MKTGRSSEHNVLARYNKAHRLNTPGGYNPDKELALLKKKEAMFVDEEGRNWSDIFWRTGEHGFACRQDSEYNGFNYLRAVRWGLRPLAVCNCQINDFWPEKSVMKRPDSMLEAAVAERENKREPWIKRFWWPQMYVCKKTWPSTLLWRLKPDKEPSNYNVAVYRMIGSSDCYVDYKFSKRFEAYKPLNEEQMNKLNAHEDRKQCPLIQLNWELDKTEGGVFETPKCRVDDKIVIDLS